MAKIAKDRRGGDDKRRAFLIGHEGDSDMSHTFSSDSFPPSCLFRDGAVVRIHFSLFCSQIRSQYGRQRQMELGPLVRK
jgi:hypothetical protein